jgi:drug/metabolite transporter (DMT)-like permease
MSGIRGWREAAAFVALTVIWGTTWAAIRIGLGGFPPLTGVSVRFLIAGALLLAVALARRVPLGRTQRERWLWLANGLATFAVPYGVVYWAEQWVPSGLASILFATFPLWVVLIGRWALPDERPDWRRLTGVVVGFVGVAVIFSEDFGRLGLEGVRLPAAALVLGAGISASGSVTLKRWAGTTSPLSLAAVPMLGTGVITGLMAAAVERGRAVELAPAPVLATVYLAVFGSAVTFTIYFWLLARRTAVAASLVSYTAPLVAVALGTFALGEPFTPRVALGGLLVLAGVASALRRSGGPPRGERLAAVR